MKLCKCGCGKEISKEKNIYISGHYWTDKKRTKETIEKMRLKLTGRKLKIETIEKLRLASSGINNPMFGKRGEKAPMYGRIGEKHPMFGRTGKKNPMFGKPGAMLGRIREKHPSWLGGISKLPYPIDFDEYLKEQIKQRDKKCILCNKTIEELKSERKKRYIHIHHINNDKDNISPENLVTLCIKCHGKVHSKIKREYWKLYLQELLKKLKFTKGGKNYD